MDSFEENIVPELRRSRRFMFSEVDIDVASPIPGLSLVCCGDSTFAELPGRRSYRNICATEASGTPWRAIVLDLAPAQQDVLLQEIRASENWLKPVFVVRESHLSPYLSDGEPPADPHEYLEEFDSRVATIKTSSTTDLSTRVSRFLAVRPGLVISPLWSASDPANYTYPLLRVWSRTPADHSAIDLERLEILKRHSLIDRIRLCKFCETGWLNYIDICPQCRSIDIQAANAIHCFTCGHVDDQTEFLSIDGLACPNCVTRLKHIGVDYDRPLETFHCNDCKCRFVEGDVIASCRVCTRPNNTSELIERRIFSYQLDRAGLSLAEQGDVKRLIDAELSQSVGTREFIWLIGWLNSAAPDKKTSTRMAMVRLPDFDEVVRASGKDESMCVAAELFRRVQEILSPTDIAMRHSEAVLFLLLPYRKNREFEKLMSSLGALEGISEMHLKVREVTPPKAMLAKGSLALLSAWLDEIAVSHE